MQQTCLTAIFEQFLNGDCKMIIKTIDNGYDTLDVFHFVEAKKNKGDEGIEIEITVLDAETNEPIPTAVIKHAHASQIYLMNSVTGSWKDTESIDSAGEIQVFLPGIVKSFPFCIEYDPGTKYMRRRNNVIEVH